MPYQGKIIHLFEDLLEVSYVVVHQDRIIHQICGDDVLVSAPDHQDISRAPGGPCGFFRRWLLGSYKLRCIQYIMFVV
jgi:hypothetical protein